MANIWTNKLYTQFDKATKLNEVVTNLAPYLTISEEEFHTNYFDIDTCNADGLDNWGRILQLNRKYEVPDWTQVFGFDTGQTLNDTDYPQNFLHGTWYGGQSASYAVDDATYRLLLKYKYSILTTNCSLASINSMMNILFSAINPTYKVAVVSPAKMMLTFKFNFFLTNEQYSIFHDNELLPLPAATDFTFEQGVIL